MSVSSEPLAAISPTQRTVAPPADSFRAPRTDSLAVNFILILAIYSLPLVVAIRPVGIPVCDPDLWWHLRVGEWVVQHRAVPGTDPFSAYGQGKAWVAYSWLYEVLLYGLYSAFGLAGVVVYRTALSLAIVAAVHRLVLRNRPSSLLAAALTGVCVLPVAMLFSERPWLFTILFGTFTVRAILDLREGRRAPLPWLLPVVFAVWANVHIQFVYGLLLLALACVAPVIDRRLHGGDEGTAAEFGSAGWRNTVMLTLACLLATLLNPYGVRLYHVIIEYATQPGPFQFVNELKAPEFREPCDWVMLGLTAAAAFALGRRPRLRSFDVLLMAGSAVLSFRSRRDLWVVVVAAAGILSAGPFARGSISWVNGWTSRRVAALVAVLVCLAAGLAVVRDLSPAGLERTVAKVFPGAAARYVAEHNCTGPLYNDFDWGGYLIHALPSLPVAIDGRTNLHGDERILRFGAVWAGARTWHDDPDLSAAGVVVANVQTPLASLLERDSRFALAYEDPVARVFMARRPIDP
jgi:hypothetical protein